ncbi:MAG: VWA domain-containing protein [Candidatus Bathyarchaeia archaeon]
MKPECELCKEEEASNFSSAFGQDMTENLLYNLFNREAGQSKNASRIDISKMIKERTHNDPYFSQESNEELQNWAQNREPGWLQEYSRMKEAKQKAWNEILDKLKKGELHSSDLPVDQLMQNFLSMIIEGLTGEGLIDLKLYRHWMYQNIYIAHPEFTEKSEKIIAKKVLEEAFASLKKLSLGEHEVKETGYGDYPSHVLREYDNYLHTYDMLDIQETLVSTAIRDSQGFEIKDEDLKARIPLHKSQSSNAILIDSSYSMRGDKFRGGIMAALAFRELLNEDFKEDSMHVIAYNQKPVSLSPGQIIKLRPYGYTDIGQALDLAIERLSKEDGNRNIFLITDGEPTASFYRDQTPEESTLRAAFVAGKEEIRLNIVMLDRRPELRRICEKMAKLNGNSILTYVDNPLNLKEFVIRSFIDFKRQRHAAQN